MKRVLMLAQGDGRRWNDLDGNPYKGQPKHLVVAAGEPVLARAVRLFQDRDCEVVLVAPLWYPSFGADSHVELERPKVEGNSLDKFLANRHLWSNDDTTVICWGDCFYTDDAANKIAFHDTNGVHYFRRPWSSEVTGHLWDESFAVSFSSGSHGDVLDAVGTVRNWIDLGDVAASKIHIFHHYAAYLGYGKPPHVKELWHTPHQTVIDDWTDDFDNPKEYEEWRTRRSEAGLFA